MAKANDYKDQHWIPQQYMNRWAVPNPVHEKADPGVFLMDKLTVEGKQRPPKSIFVATDFYTRHAPDGSRDVSLELLLGEVESEFENFYKLILERLHPMEGTGRKFLLMYIAIMKARTKGFRDHQRGQWENIVKIGEELEAAVKKRKAEGRLPPPISPLGRRDKSITLDQAREIVKHPMSTLLLNFAQPQVEIMERMSLSIFFTDDPIGFISSDQPVVWYDPAQPVPGLGSPTIEITMPLSPKYLAIITHDKDRDGYFYAPPVFVDELNRRNVQHAGEHFFSHTSEVRPEWFLNKAIRGDAYDRLYASQIEAARAKGFIK